MHATQFTFRILLVACLLGSLPARAQYLGGSGDGSFTAAAVSAVAPLDLLEFSAEANGSATGLHWQTANEEDTHFFEIQRATTTGGPFTVVGRLDAAGHSRPGQVLAYQFTDEDPPVGRSYYRLRSVDLDGSFQYSAIVSASHAAATASFAIFPNPGDGRSLQLRLAEPPLDPALHVEVLDATGRRQVADQTVPVRGDVAALTFAERLPAGSYLVRLHSGQQTWPARLLIVAD